MDKLTSKQARLIATSLWDFTWSQPLNAYLSVTSILETIDTSTNDPAIQQELVKHLKFLNEQFSENEHVAALRADEIINAETREVLEELASTERTIDSDMLHTLLRVDVVSIVLRRLVERILESFVEGVLKREGAPLGGVGRGAIGFAARASKGLFEKVSNQLEGPLRQTMAGFVHGSMDRLRQELADILQREELQASFGEARLTLLNYALSQPLQRWYEIGLTADEVNLLIDELPALIGQIVQHPTCRQAVESQLETAFESIGDQPLQDVCPPEVRMIIDKTVGEPIITRWTTFFRSKQFQDCLPPQST